MPSLSQAACTTIGVCKKIFFKSFFSQESIYLYKKHGDPNLIHQIIKRFYGLQKRDIFYEKIARCPNSVN